MGKKKKYKLELRLKELNRLTAKAKEDAKHLNTSMAELGRFSVYSGKFLSNRPTRKGESEADEEVIHRGFHYADIINATRTDWADDVDLELIDDNDRSALRDAQENWGPTVQHVYDMAVEVRDTADKIIKYISITE